MFYFLVTHVFGYAPLSQFEFTYYEFRISPIRVRLTLKYCRSIYKQNILEFL